MSDSPNEPVRLRVTYKSPESLLGEFTRSVGKGAVALESRHSLPPGTRFVFELRAHGVTEPVEVYGEVIECAPAEHRGKHRLVIRYDPGTDRKGLDAVLRRVFDAHQFEKVRKHPRIPIHLHATEDTPYSPSYLVRDISRGGVGVEVEAASAPRVVKVGAPFLLEVSISLGVLMLHGEVVWTAQPPPERVKWINPSFGVAFGKLRPDTIERLERILVLRGLPPPPWKTRVSFGLDAVSRMP